MGRVWCPESQNLALGLQIKVSDSLFNVESYPSSCVVSAAFRLRQPHACPQPHALPHVMRVDCNFATVPGWDRAVDCASSQLCATVQQQRNSRCSSI